MSGSRGGFRTIDVMKYLREEAVAVDRAKSGGNGTPGIGEKRGG